MTVFDRRRGSCFENRPVTCIGIAGAQSEIRSLFTYFFLFAEKVANSPLIFRITKMRRMREKGRFISYTYCARSYFLEVRQVATFCETRKNG